MVVKLEDVTIRYGSLVAVDRVSVEFPTGAVGLLGRNGAGKSSILRALLGLVRPASGSMRILDLPPGAPAADVRRRVGYMPERDCSIPGLNGFETVSLAARLTGLPPRDAFRRAHEVLYLVGLEEQRYRLVSGYSAGMRQKVKLATALVHDPEILFLDEPTNGLDPHGREEMLRLVGKLARDLGKSVVLSSHILQDVESLCHSIVLLEKGRVLAQGTLAELTRNPRRVYELGVVGCERAELEARLTALGTVSVEEVAPAQLRLTVPEDLSTQALFGAVAAAGGEVRRLVEHRRTLEDVFLGAVQGAQT
jgi:ABC-2 type transport system ATP-binding protein